MGVWSDWLYGLFLLPVPWCTAVRWYGSYSSDGCLVQAEVQVDGDWLLVYDGGWPRNAWIEAALPAVSLVECVRLRVRPAGNEIDKIAEVEVYQGDPIVAKTFEVIYQAAGAGTGKTVQVDVYRPDKTKDDTQSGPAQEVGTTGRYYKNFTATDPDWFVEVSDSAGGKAVRCFDKKAWDGHGLADLVADVQTAVDAANAALAALATATAGLGTDLAALGLDVGALAANMATALSQLTSIEDKVDDLESPPMIG